MQGSNTLTLFEITFRKPPISGERDTHKQKTQKMKKLIIKLLGLETLVTVVTSLRKENEELKNQIKDLLMAQEGLKASLDEVTEKVDEMESPDLDEYVREDDINDRIESYMNDNDYVTQSYCDDEIESKVSDKVEEAIEDLDLEDKVKEVVDDMDKASFGDTQELRDEITRQMRVMFQDELEVKIKLK